MLLIKKSQHPINGLFKVLLAISAVILLTATTSFLHYQLLLPWVLYTPVITCLVLAGIAQNLNSEGRRVYSFYGIKVLTL